VDLVGIAAKIGKLPGLRGIYSIDNLGQCIFLLLLALQRGVVSRKYERVKRNRTNATIVCNVPSRLTQLRKHLSYEGVISCITSSRSHRRLHDSAFVSFLPSPSALAHLPTMFVGWTLDPAPPLAAHYQALAQLPRTAMAVAPQGAHWPVCLP
jgi:hypothetical protein